MRPPTKGKTMFAKPQPKSNLQNVIDHALIDITGHDPATDEFSRAVDQIAKLHKMKESENPSRVSPDTLVLAATNIAGIVLIIKHEHFNVITSKALGFVLKPR